MNKYWLAMTCPTKTSATSQEMTWHGLFVDDHPMIIWRLSYDKKIFQDIIFESHALKHKHMLCLLCLMMVWKLLQRRSSHDNNDDTFLSWAQWKIMRIPFLKIMCELNPKIVKVIKYLTTCRVKRKVREYYKSLFWPNLQKRREKIHRLRLGVMMIKMYTNSWINSVFNFYWYNLCAPFSISWNTDFRYDTS